MTINKHQIYFYLLLIVAFTIPFPLKTHAIGYSTIALSLGWIFLGEWQNKFQRLKTNPLFFIFLIYYLLMISGLFYSINKSEAKYLLEKSMSLLIFPLLVFSFPSISDKKLFVIIKTFIFSCLILSLADLAYAGYQSYKSGINQFDYLKLETFLGMHHSYFAMYCSFSVLMIAIHTYRNFQNMDRLAIFFRILLCLYFAVFTYLIAARMGLASMILILTILLFIHFYKRKVLLKGLIVSGISLLIIIISLLSLPNMQKRFHNMFPETWEWKGHNTQNEWLTRKVHWGCYLEAISENNLIWGVGTGDSFENVAYCMKRWEFYGYYYKWNAHNQYLEIMLRWGIIGLVLWLSMLLIPLWFSLKRKHIYYAVFIALFALSCFTETMLDRQHGVVFYAFFNAVFGSCFLWKTEK